MGSKKFKRILKKLTKNDSNSWNLCCFEKVTKQINSSAW